MVTNPHDLGSRIQSWILLKKRTLNRGVHDVSCIIGNQGKMAGNLKVYVETQNQIILFILKHLRLPLLQKEL